MNYNTVINNITRTFFTLLMISSTVFSQGFIFESKENKVNIIELYTSEGCSSCPRADEWLSKLKANEKVFTEFIPMAFHITYWDFIGWKDSFADKMYDSRQRYYANKVWKNNSVYTPQFIINSKEYKRWFKTKSFPIFKKEYGGKLKVNYDKNILKINYQNKKIKDKKIYLNMAILGFDYKINIKKGENKYKTLEHDFVVIKHIQKFAKIENNKLNVNINNFFNKEDNRQYALVVWLSSYDSEILQATGGYI